MAGYKQPCLHCGSLVDRDARFCPSCGSSNPFGHLCPTCLHPIEKEHAVCQSCGRELRIECPFCHQATFVQTACESCGKSLMVQCKNRRCGDMQFFQNTKCTSCGKRIR